VRVVRVVRVFGARDGFLRFFNLFHYTTKPAMIEREVTLRPGDLWDDVKVRETGRRLRDPIVTARVVTAPVKSPHPGVVDLLVVTRDVWSLRMNSNFEFQERTLTDLTISLSENNFFGYRKQVALVFDMDQGKYFLGPLYHDRNLAGTRLQLRAFGGPLFGRASGQLEGAQQSTTLAYPLWSVDSKWGAETELVYRDAIARVFQGADLYTYDVPETDDIEAVPYQYRLRQTLLETSVTRSLVDDGLIIGIMYFWQTGAAASERRLATSPSTATTLSWVTSFVTAFDASSGLL